MKKILSICLVALLAMPAMAAEPKEERAKRDYSEWLPAAGDVSLGFSVDLSPLASFVGNLFNGTIGNTWEYGDIGGETLGMQNIDKVDPATGQPIKNMVSIMGAYMLTDQLGIRANLGFSVDYDNVRSYQVDDAALANDPFSQAEVIDTRKTTKSGGSFAVGVDYRVGKRAVQGVFGGGLMYGLSVDKTRYAYGNAITELNQIPTSGVTTTYNWSDKGLPYARPLETCAKDPTHFFGLYGTVGVEWFVAPKVALGMNVNLNLVYTLGSQEIIVAEGWDVNTEEVRTHIETVSPGNTGFKFGTDNIGSNLYVAFYF